MTLTEKIQQIQSDIDDSVTAFVNVVGDNEYILIDSVKFYNATESLATLNVTEDAEEFIDYLDLEIRAGAISANLRDKPSNGLPAKVSSYNFDFNTLELVTQTYGDADFIDEFYLLNAVGSDFELQSGGYVLLPEG